MTLAMAFAAMRLAEPSAQQRIGVQQVSKSVPIPMAALPFLPNVGGCSAYGPKDSAKPGIPYDENAGAATEKINSFFGMAETKDKAPAKLPASVHYAIALAPDPVHTHLSLMFDREIAMVQQAAQDEGYVYNSSWFPWKDEADGALEHLADRQYSADLTVSREACPGVMLFRRNPVLADPPGQVYANALVVFVAGEQPTGGINEDQWANSIAFLSRYAQAPNPGTLFPDGTLRILGPTFTGSLTSLERLLVKAYSTQKTKPGTIATPFPKALVLSGSVTGCPVIQWFERRMQEPPLKGRVGFGSFQESDALHIFRFLEYLKRQGTEPRDTAILSEDETAYAGTISSPAPDSGPAAVPSDGCDFPYVQEDRPIHMVYPRDISALRDAYEKQSVFGTGDDARRSARSILKDQIEDREEDRITDTVQTYGKSISALDQEAYLFGVVSFLRTHHTRYLLLRCTNPLDFLFLTRFFHREYPEARIVIVGSDMLLRREIDTTEFRGVLALSSFPLIPRGQHWSKITEDDWEVQPHNHLIFEGHAMEGIYIAARYVLTASVPVPVATDPKNYIPPIRLPRSFPTPDYSDPFWFSAANQPFPATHPPTWLAVIGRDGFWPVAVIRDDQDRRDSEFDKLRLEVPRDDPSADWTRPRPLPRSTMVELTGTFVADPKLADEHYQLKLDFSDPRQYIRPPAFDGLQLHYPMPWIVCLLIAAFLAAYQLIGVIHGSTKAYRIYSIFRRTVQPHKDLFGGRISSQDVLLATSCALGLMPMVEVLGFGSFPEVAATLEGGILRSLFEIALGLAVPFMTGALYLRYEKPPKLLEFKMERPVWLFFLLFLGLETVAYYEVFSHGLSEVNRIPLVYRMAHLTCGVSPLVPILILTLGFYLWNWHAVAGNLMLAAGAPELPPRIETGPRTTDEQLDKAESRISQEVAIKVDKVARPLTFPWRVIAIPLFLLISAVVCFKGSGSLTQWNLPLLSLEGNCFNLALNALLLLGFLLTAAEALRLYFTWVSLQRLLHALSRLRLRRTLARLRPIDTHSLWSVSGNVPRIQYRLFDRQLGAARRTCLLIKDYYRKNGGIRAPLPALHGFVQYGDGFRQTVESNNSVGILWDSPALPLPEAVAVLIRPFACAAVAEVLNVVLLPEWKTETTSLNIEGDQEEAEASRTVAAILPLSDKEHIEAAEEFVCFHYIAYIQNIAARLRTMTFSMILLFVSVCFSISFYPFVPRTEISVWMILNLALIGLAVAFVYAEMDRDEIMSYIANTKPGQLGAEFWIKLFGFLIGPVIGILTTQFPAIADSALRWLQPGLDAIK
jgi:hypothetical protein